MAARTPSGLLLACAAALAAGCGDEAGYFPEGGGPPPFDCTTVPADPFAVTEELVGPIGWHDLAFDDQGHLIGTDGSQLFKATSTGETEPFGAMISSAQGMDHLPDGDLVVASADGLLRVAPDGSRTTLSSALAALYGVTVGPDGMIYTADNANLYRVDPDTGATETLIASSPTLLPRAVEFSPDLDTMYVVSFCPDVPTANVFAVALDDDFNPIGDPQPFANAYPGGCWIDGIGVDACGNVYYPVYEAVSLYRFSPAGELTATLSWDGDLTKYGHGLEWGTGAHGWDAESLYMPRAYGNYTVIRVDIGVPYRE